ncbi:MAG TPA: CDP-glycerol glycerophosphotransferase family protein [bacterium]|nr:CDP-glycerol glycerophosphotransferase family protein [bacterium]
MNQAKILFAIAHEYHRASLDPIYASMKQRGSFDIYFACTDERVGKWPFFKRSRRRAVEEALEREGLRVTREKRGFDAVVTGDILPDPQHYGGSLLCFINHGTGIKTILYRLLAKHRDTKYLVFVEGNYRKRRIEEFGVEGASEILVVGYPKLDPIFQGKLGRDQIMRRWNLDQSRPTVLYAPTYKPTSLSQIREKILAATEGYNLIIKLHDYSWRGRYAPHWHHRIYEKAVPEYPHARLVPPEEHNILPFIVAADTMISEASSTIFEFLALGRVGIIYDLACDRLKHHDGMPILDEDNRRFLDKAFVHIGSPDQIPAAIDRALNADAAMKANLEQARNELFYGLDGHASDRIVDVIENRLGLRS